MILAVLVVSLFVTISVEEPKVEEKTLIAEISTER